MACFVCGDGTPLTFVSEGSVTSRAGCVVAWIALLRNEFVALRTYNKIYVASVISTVVCTAVVLLSFLAGKPLVRRGVVQEVITTIQAHATNIQIRMLHGALLF